jgi:thiamine transporter 2/3
MWSDLSLALSDGNILRWSVWWALAMCGNFQVGNYIQPLWETIAPVHQQTHIYNGAVEAVATILGQKLPFRRVHDAHSY